MKLDKSFLVACRKKEDDQTKLKSWELLITLELGLRPAQA
jgi:hypothetical protein